MPEDDEDAGDSTRLDALSDGVFAVALTLLVLDLRVPLASEAPDASALLGALGQEWPSFAAYAVSFGAILVMWVNHRNILRLIDGPDVPFHFLNGLLLLMVTITPFSTALFAEHFGHGGEQVAGAVYAGAWVLTGLVFNVWWRYAAHHRRLIAAQVPDEVVRAISRQYLIAPPLYALAFALVFVSVAASLALSFGLALFYAITASTTRGRRVRPHGA